MLAILTAVVLSQTPDSPVKFGWEALKAAAGSKAARVKVHVDNSSKLPREGYRIVSNPSRVDITAADATGAMYGCLDFAEKLRTLGDKAWTMRTSTSPFLKDRGLNLFLTLPWSEQKHDTDYDLAALRDPDRWWFQNDDYWKTLLDTMAVSRLNWLDIHGAWDISVTNAPNLYAYFVTSPSFPKVGVPQDIKARNLQRLNEVVQMAHARGIRVSLMAYEANLKVPQNPDPPYRATEDDVYKYTREAVTAMIQQCPGLDAIGFRIGESGKSESFFRCYGEAVKASGRQIPLITRSWITTKQKILPLARDSHDFTVEIKYNGEQWAAPYMIAGGRMASWGSYSFEDYLSDSGPSKLNSQTWAGNTTSEGGQWPSQPYKIVWQVRANGTHRVFPFNNPELVRSTIKQMKIGTASGFTIEGLDAYYPKTPGTYLKKPDRGYRWTHQRDELYWVQWGRLGYDPKTPASTFSDYAWRWFGEDSPRICADWNIASLIVPLLTMARSLGPDHRNHAPEFETGGSTQDFISTEGFDPLVFRSIQEDVLYKTLGLEDGRVPPQDVAYDLGFLGLASDRKGEVTGRIGEIEASSSMLGALARYHSNRIKAAYEVAENDRLSGFPAQDSYAREKMDAAVEAWKALADLGDKHYQPLTERLRMGTNTYTWRSQLQAVQNQATALTGLPKAKTLTEWSSQPAHFSDPATLTWNRKNGSIEVSVRDSGDIVDASVLYKPLPSSTFFHKLRMVKSPKGWTIQLPSIKAGYCLASEVTRREGGKRIVSRVPSLSEDGLDSFRAPYVVVPAQSGPTPQYYSTEEALAHLDSRSLDPSELGTMIVAPRAWQFFNRFDNANKRKVLDAVERGMTLIVLQQDFVSGRYKLDWLPKPLKAEACPEPSRLDAGGAFGIKTIQTPDILWQRFVPSQGWTVFGNGGFAKLNHGRGKIWVSSARLMQRMTNAECARALKAFVETNGHEKPAVILDPGTEGGNLTTAFWPDFLNALDVPFLTLGEVIARKQSMTWSRAVAGPVSASDVLNGTGPAMVNKFFRDKVVSAAHRTASTTVAAFEVERSRRKKELMRCLGLDPLPARTPLNAKTTGIISRPGYTIEKVVFESRPRFYVTAYVYKTENASGSKLPVIVNVNGHWAHKKAEDRLQLRCAFQALHGYIAIAIDSPGFSFEGDSLIERRAEGDHNDFALVQGGTNATGLYVWDAMRALDYMATRADTDMSRVGLTGASGGGLATLYAFAADDRYKAAVPVVYMASMESAPDNGCLCNHVPGTCQIGDRSDVLAIQAPKPVYIMGAENDGEFPPNAMRLTADKSKVEWSLLGHGNDVKAQIFSGPHDYNQPMREAMIGFFDQCLRGQGTGAPVPQPEISVFDPEDPQYLVLENPPSHELTMRDVLKDRLSETLQGDFVKANGGIPSRSPINLKQSGTSHFKTVTFESEPGLITPGVLLLPDGPATRLRIVASDGGKASLMDSVKPGPGTAVLILDLVGTGELANVELRYPVYLGRSLAFTGAWQLVRAAEAFRGSFKEVECECHGPLTSTAATFAGHMGAQWSRMTATDCLQSWSDVFDQSLPAVVVQPRANLCEPLSELRKSVPRATWQIRH